MPLKRMTLIGTETYLNQLTPSLSISDNWSLENETFDKETLLATIIRTGGRFEPLYADPEYFRTHCQLWWKSYTRTFEKWFDVFDKTYEPLWNKDYFEEIHEDTYDSGSESTEHSQTTTVDDDTSYAKKGNDKIVEDDDNKMTESGTTKTVTDNDGTDQESGTTRVQTDDDSKLRAPGASGSNGSTTTNEVSAYDSANYSAHDRSSTTTNKSEDTERDIDQVTTHGLKHTTTEDVTETITHGKVLTGTDDKTTTRNWGESGSGTDDSTTETEGTSATDRSNDRDFDREAHMYGNIGVMSTQDLIKQEIEVQSVQLYQKIADLFCKDLLITVY